MSQPSCTIEEIEELDPTSFDASLGGLLSKCEGETAKYLSVVFGYLKRKTNFFKEGDAENKVMEALKQVMLATKLKPGPSGVNSAVAQAAPVTSSPDPASSTMPLIPPPMIPASMPDPSPAPTSTPASTTTSTSKPTSEADMETLEDEEPKSKGLKPNPGRGYDYPHYSWTQTLSEVNASVRFPPGTKAKMLDVVIAKNRLKVGVKGQPAVLEGDLVEPIKTEDSMWNIEGGVVELSLVKAEGMHWWGAVLKGEETIDVQKVEPENSKLQDLDAETRQTVEKMMFDQRQKALGRPTSDEMKKEQMLQNFMKAHPEMDFSKMQKPIL